MDTKAPTYIDYGISPSEAERVHAAISRKKSLQRYAGQLLIVAYVIFVVANTLAHANQVKDPVSALLIAALVMAFPALFLWWIIRQLWDHAWSDIKTAADPDFQKLYGKYLLYEFAVTKYKKDKAATEKKLAKSPRSENAAVTPKTMTRNEAHLIVDAYGKILEYAGPRGALFNAIVDINRLPYSKQTIKSAIQTLLKYETDDKYISALKTCYLCLVAFQPGVGDGELQIIDFNGDYRDKGDIEKIISKLDVSTIWHEMVFQEFDTLKKELGM